MSFIGGVTPKELVDLIHHAEKEDRRAEEVNRQAKEALAKQIAVKERIDAIKRSMKPD